MTKKQLKEVRKKHDFTELKDSWNSATPAEFRWARTGRRGVLSFLIEKEAGGVNWSNEILNIS